MKFCSCIAEYNPLHLGHLKHLSYMRNNLDSENIIVIMSGNFTQRGEPAVMNKFKRAKQAVIGGADLVIELPSVFATANAELFAKGAVAVLDGLGINTGLCFGVESGEKTDYLALANAMNDESKEFKKILKEHLSKGVSLAKAKFETVKELGNDFDENLISSPNNILGIEYTKAILKNLSSIEIYPMIRDGEHNNETLKKGLTSALSIRKIIRDAQFKKLKKSIPPFVYQELNEYPFDFDKLIISKVLTTPAEKISEILDCTEGLENRIKALVKDNLSVNSLVEKVSTKRYTMSRIRRILTANLLGINEQTVFDTLKDGLYAKVLAVRAEKKNILSSIQDTATIPIITRKSDVLSLNKFAQRAFEIDTLANDLYNLATNENSNENLMIIV